MVFRTLLWLLTENALFCRGPLRYPIMSNEAFEPGNLLWDRQATMLTTKLRVPWYILTPHKKHSIASCCFQENYILKTLFFILENFEQTICWDRQTCWPFLVQKLKINAANLLIVDISSPFYLWYLFYGRNIPSRNSIIIYNNWPADVLLRTGGGGGGGGG